MSSFTELFAGLVYRVCYCAALAVDRALRLVRPARVDRWHPGCRLDYAPGPHSIVAHRASRHAEAAR